MLITVVIDDIRSKSGTFKIYSWQNTELGVCKKHLMYIILSSLRKLLERAGRHFCSQWKKTKDEHNIYRKREIYLKKGRYIHYTDRELKWERAWHISGSPKVDDINNAVCKCKYYNFLLLGHKIFKKKIEIKCLNSERCPKC